MSDVCWCVIPAATAMKLGIMQPYFFPYLGHFALIAAVDEWVVFDVTQYTRKSWINRNRILCAAGGWQYVSAPLANSSIHISIADAAIANPSKLEKYVLGKLSHYARGAPHYRTVCDIVRTAFARSTGSSLVSLNVSGLRTVCDYLGLEFRHRICSQLALECPEGLTAGQWAPWIAARLAADIYVNPVGGQVLFNPADFAASGIGLQFLDFRPLVYDTPGYTFEGNLSILDVLMWNAGPAVRQAIHDNSTLISKA
jgi:WbqC-like protein family